MPTLPAQLPSCLVHALQASCLALMLGIASSAAGDDTEVFFSGTSTSGNSATNVLFVLDTSGSMGATDGGSTSRIARMKEAMRAILSQTSGVNVGLMRYNGVYGGGPVLYPITAIDKTICTDSSCLASSLASSAGSEWDDVEQALNNNNIDGTAHDLSLGTKGGVAQAVGLRFSNINIPRGATILRASLAFTARGNSSGSSTLELYTQDSKDAAVFDSNDESVTDRNWNGSPVTWSPGSWNDENSYETPELSSIVQKVIDRVDWCNGGALAFQVTGSGQRTAHSKDSGLAFDNGFEPRLNISFDASSVSTFEGCGVGVFETSVAQSADDAEQNLSNNFVNTDSIELDIPKDGGIEQRVGVRFQGVDIPQGATILDATMEFEVRSHRTGQGDVTIHGDDTANTQPYANSGDRINARTRTSASVDWVSIPEAAVGAKVQSPDVASIVEEIVGRTDWVAGNALAFSMVRKSGTSRRSYKSYDQGAGTAPTLRVTYEGGVASGSGSGGSGNTTTTDGSGSLIIESAPGTSTARDKMIEIVDNLTHAGGTPTIDSYYEAARYFRGEAIDFGNKRGVTNNNWKKQQFRVSHPESYTGGTVVRAANCHDDNLNSSNCTSEYISGSPIYVSPIASSCQANHIVLLSDGETDRNDVTGRIRALTGDTSCADGGDEACATELASWLKTADHGSSIPGTQSISTHTVAFNLNGKGKDFLERIALAGGGTAYEADTAGQLVEVFDQILTSVLDFDTGFTAPSATVNQFNRLAHRDDIYFAMFKPGSTPQWPGNLKRFRVGKDASGAGEVLIRDVDGNPAIDDDTGYISDSARSWWPERDNASQVISTPDGNNVERGGAANQLKLAGIAGIGSRRVYTWLGDAINVPAQGVDLTASTQLLHESNADLDDARLSISNVANNAGDQAAYRERLVRWARGVDVLDSDGDGSTEDVRAHMGSPMHSQPIVVNYADSGAPQGVRSIVFVATNEGFLHALDTATGEERYAFIPNELLANLKTFYENGTGETPYGLDGSLSLWRTDPDNNSIVDSGESAYLYMGMRRGGKQYYALDVSALDSPKLAWAIKGGSGGSAGFDELGQSWSRMAPVKIMMNNQVRDVLIFGGGYDAGQDPVQSDDDHPLNTASQGRGVFMVDAITGELVWSGLGVAGGTQLFPEMQYSIPGNVRSIDVNRDGLVDQMYVADTGGQLWRFDLVQQHQGGALASGGVIATLGGPDGEDRRRFFNEPDVALVEDEGKQFLTVALGSGWRPHPLDDVIEDRFYVIRQYAVRSAPQVYGKASSDPNSSTALPITEADLTPVVLQDDPATSPYGWYLDLPGQGEKILGRAVTFDGSVVFSSYLPEAQVSACTASVGGARAYVLDVATGAPSRDLNNDGVIRAQDDSSVTLLHGGIPPEATILLSEQSEDDAQLFIGTQQIDTGFSVETQRTFWSDKGDVGVVAELEQSNPTD